MTSTGQSSRVLHADPEHGNLRFVVIVVLILALVLSFLLIQFLIGWLAADSRLHEFTFVISCAGAIPLALGIAWLIEKLLKREWHSGTMLALDESQLRYIKGKSGQTQPSENADEVVFEWSKRLNLTRWFFRLKGYPRAGRERRVSDKWLCLACQLQQDDARLIVFGYLPPDRALSWTENQHLKEPFHPISLSLLYEQAGKKRQVASIRPKIPSSMLTGTDGRFWLAEQRRWQEGTELAKEELTAFLEYLDQKM